MTAHAKALRHDVLRGPAKDASAGVESRAAPEGFESRKGMAVVTPGEEGPESSEVGPDLTYRLTAGLGRERSGPGLKQGDRSEAPELDSRRDFGPGSWMVVLRRGGTLACFEGSHGLSR